MQLTTSEHQILHGEGMVDAIYSNQIVQDYESNPLIEALPPIFTEDEVIEQISVFPPFDEKERKLNPSYRFHCIQRLFQYFQPFEKHLDLEQRISRAIRQGYLHRNPMKKEEIMRVHESYKAIKEGKFIKNYQTEAKRTAAGFTIIGLSGIGKSTAIERVLSFYPQIIKHQEYQGRPFQFTQICWLKLDCPFDGSLKGLCMSFFSELDRLLGSNYLNKFGSQKNTTDLMMQRMAHLASRHGIGLLIIDEVQHLSLSKSGGSDKMLNFFVTLVNTIGIPVLMVGTNKAISILQSEFRQARRGSGQGDMVWSQMPKDESWDLFVEGMWEYQWTTNFTELTSEFSYLLYEESQGILDIAVKLFMLSQIRAIATGKEKITKQIINQVASDSLRLVRPMLEALKSGIPSEIAKYEDIRPIDMDEEIEKYKASIDMQEKIRIQKKLQLQQGQKKEQSLLEDVTLQLLSMDFDPKTVEGVVKKVFKNLGEDLEKSTVLKEAVKLLIDKDEKKAESKAKKKKMEPTNENYLVRSMQEARQKKKSVHEFFLDKGIIKQPLDEFWEDEEDAALVSHSVS
ncbi:TPA: ATP-binding protein [Bacillus cereus]|uniref:ATP-binding protein n=1 Tax=Bacillus TaxID=1386 RepID=UPI001015338E|nr:MULTISPECIES: ATP-binding protein [Bacillus]GCF74530.1 transposase [Bacillus cereus]MDA1898251.1 ATP-binding protein [Bacillus cereus group sp. BcHK28]MDA1961441.1 ATP-binding protein [Bacillus cereus group sp. BcHK10]HDR8456050.1 ATP-binding protein [Bacillus cereus]HDX9601051.1 ATP-binding protein [Bacillus cereus]